MDPVLATALATVVVGGVSGFALVLSSRSNSSATATAALLKGQGDAIMRMEGQIAARDSTIEDLRQRHDECDEKVRALTQSLTVAHERIETQSVELEQLRAKLKELGDG